jgi:hypothetical protein
MIHDTDGAGPELLRDSIGAGVAEKMRVDAVQTVGSEFHTGNLIPGSPEAEDATLSEKDAVQTTIWFFMFFHKTLRQQNTFREYSVQQRMTRERHYYPEPSLGARR